MPYTTVPASIKLTCSFCYQAASVEYDHELPLNWSRLDTSIGATVITRHVCPICHDKLLGYPEAQGEPST